MVKTTTYSLMVLNSFNMCPDLWDGWLIENVSEESNHQAISSDECGIKHDFIQLN